MINEIQMGTLTNSAGVTIRKPLRKPDAALPHFSSHFNYLNCFIKSLRTDRERFLLLTDEFVLHMTQWNCFFPRFPRQPSANIQNLDERNVLEMKEHAKRGENSFYEWNRVTHWRKMLMQLSQLLQPVKCCVKSLLFPKILFSSCLLTISTCWDNSWD